MCEISIVKLTMESDRSVSVAFALSNGYRNKIRSLLICLDSFAKERKVGVGYMKMETHDSRTDCCLVAHFQWECHSGHSPRPYPLLISRPDPADAAPVPR